MTRNGSNDTTLVVVATGAEARFFRNEGANGQFRLKPAGSMEPANLTDDGPAGKRPPESSRRETDEATFSKQLANRLYKRSCARDFDALIIIADPDTLGELRPQLHSEVIDRLVLEVPKTLINSPVEDIERSLSALA